MNDELPVLAGTITFCPLDSLPVLEVKAVTDEPVDVALVSVSYQCRDELLGLLASIEQNPSSSNVEIHVADNASTDGTEELVRRRFPEVDILQVGYNSGFSRANNAAISRNDV